MATNRAKTYFAVAALLGALAAGAGYSGLSSLATQAASEADRKLVPVVVVASDVTFGTKLDPNMLRVVSYPKESVPAGAYPAIDSVVGHVTKVFLSAREPVTATKLSSRGGGLSMLIRSSMRATSVEVNQVSGVSGFVLPGDRVDVLVTVAESGPTREAFTRTIQQNTEVLAAGQRMEQQDNKPVTVQAVTLLVDPKGAEALALAQHQGKIHLVLRNPEDLGTPEVAGLSTKEMLGRSTPPARVAVARPTRTPEPARASEPAASRAERAAVRIIRDAKVSETPFPNDSL